jgi:regulator of protease activity HflC (stomatin/prohibitin superfamily)
MFTIGLSVVLFIGGLIGLSIKRNSQKVYFQFSGKSLLAFLAFLILVPTFFVQVDANEVGIVYDPLNGGIQDIAMGEGLHLKTPFQEVKIISTKLRESSYTVTAQTGIIIKENDEGEIEETGGGQWATYQVTIQYKVEVANAQEFYRKFGGDTIPQSTMEARLREALQTNSVEYDIFTILKGGLNDVRAETEIDLQESLAELGITVEAFIILDVDAGDEIEQVVRDEATAAKQKEIAIKDQEAELIRQETEKLSAEIQAETILIEAEANAEAQRILNSVTANAIYTMYAGQFLDDLGVLDEAAKLEFETNGTGGYLTIQEISDIVIYQLYYDTWDGVLPEVLTGTDTTILVTPGE